MMPLVSAVLPTESAKSAVRCINVINFIRAIEPRFKTDLLEPVRHQMEINKRHGLPATWLLQFDALVSGPFVAYLRDHMAKDHEIGFWFEMNQMHCEAAGVKWRGRPGYEWDHYPTVAFTIGYTHEERIRLADTAMREFKKVWGHYSKSVASWNLDSFTLAHLTETYGMDAYAVCRDQIATDGFTIWGAPIAGYYPSKKNCWSPAVDIQNQIKTPIYRMLGQDPVYYYDKNWKMPDGRTHGEPDTMEPVWPSGRSPEFVRHFLKMIAESPTGQFAYAQLGQENSFPWNEQVAGYEPQMKALAALRAKGTVHVETMGETGRRFKKAFAKTPGQAQVMLDDPFGNAVPARTVWYQNHRYRANLHFRDKTPYLRDLIVYDDSFAQPYLDQPTTTNDVEQRMLAAVDGYHWSEKPGSTDTRPAGVYLFEGDSPLLIGGRPRITETSGGLEVVAPLSSGAGLHVGFRTDSVVFKLGGSAKPLALELQCDLAKAPQMDVRDKEIHYLWQDHRFALGVAKGTARSTKTGWRIESENNTVEIKLRA